MHTHICTHTYAHTDTDIHTDTHTHTQYYKHSNRAVTFIGCNSRGSDISTRPSITLPNDDLTYSWPGPRLEDTDQPSIIIISTKGSLYIN